MKVRELVDVYNSLVDQCHKLPKDLSRYIDDYDHYDSISDMKTTLEDFVRNLPPKYNLVVKCNYPTSEIIVFDGQYNVIHKEYGELVAQLPKGLYKLAMKSDQFTLFEARFLEIVETNTLLDIKSETKEI